MTREEARQIIATWLVSSKGAKGQRGYIEGWFDEEDVEAFRMAIEALSEQSLINKDAVSREGLLKSWEELSPRGRLEFEQVIMTIPALPSADAVSQLKQTDTLIIADALRYLAKDTERHLADRTRADSLRQQFLKYGASMCKGGDDECV